MTVTQAKRVIRFRDTRGLTSLDELDDVPGFSQDFLSGIKAQLIP